MPSPAVGMILRQRATGRRVLTLSAGVGTDAERLAALTGDGLPLGSGFSVYPAATNLLANSNGDVDTTGLTDNSSTTSAIASTAKFNGRAFQVVSGNATANEGPSQDITGGLASTQYTVSAWAWLISGAATVRAVVYDTVGGKQGGTAVALTTTPQRIRVTATTGALGINEAAYIETTVQQAGTWAFGGWQAETGAVATPYVANGGTRVAGRVRLPVQGLFTTTQGWVASRIRSGAVYASVATAEWFFSYATDGNSYVGAYMSNSAPSFLEMERKNGGAGGGDVQQSVSVVVDTMFTGIGAWTSGFVRTSLNGAAFTQTANTSIPSVATTTIDLSTGGLATAVQVLGNAYWSLLGKGTLTDADAALPWMVLDTVPTLTQIDQLSQGAKATCLVPGKTADAILLPAYYEGAH